MFAMEYYQKVLNINLLLGYDISDKCFN